MIARPDVSGYNGIVMLFVLVPVALTAWGGINLYQLKKSGFDLTFASLGLQTLWLTGPRTAYKFFLGLQLWVGWEKIDQFVTPIGVNFIGESSLRISWEPQDIPFGIGINFVAIALLVLLSRWKKQREIALEIQKDMIALSASTEVNQPPDQPTV
jgi:hypothetical protein